MDTKLQILFTTDLFFRIYRRMSSFSESSIQPPAPVVKLLKDIDQWSFNVFELDELSGGNALRFMGYELLRTQGLISKLRVCLPIQSLDIQKDSALSIFNILLQTCWLLKIADLANFLTRYSHKSQLAFLRAYQLRSILKMCIINCNDNRYAMYG